MFKNPFSFQGRIRRTEFGLSYVIFIAFCFISGGLIGFLATYMDKSTASILFLLPCIPSYWFLFAQGAKRCHDRGNSGWFQIIPLYGFWMLFADSDNGINKYGPNPKGIGNIDEIDEIGNYLAT
ncbi:MAG TPA: DUF805 domain-containing protein [Chitinophagaceae bacterium]|jgi:Predicted membrane protein